MTTILIVEDDADNARMMARMLRMRGYQVLNALDGRTAVDMTRQHRPDLILMDLFLEGGIDGLEATRQIKADATTQTIPIIVLSATQTAAFQDEALRAGAVDVDDKPVEFDRLEAKIRAALPTS
jgi:two-component system, cell cycle response regulator DivK